MKPLFPFVIIATLCMASAYADPAKPLYLPPTASQLYFTPRVFIFRHRVSSADILRDSVASNLGFSPRIIPSGALMDWKHVDSFSVFQPRDWFRFPLQYSVASLPVKQPISMGSWHRSSSYGEYFEDLRRERYADLVDSTSLHKKIVVGKKFVASEFATSELPSVYLHKPAPIMKYALEAEPSPFVTTFDWF